VNPDDTQIAASGAPDDPADATPVDRRTEVTAGLTTFLTMSYIVFVNPDMLSKGGLDFSAVLTATVLAAAIGSILMGLIARLPYALAPGMGINAIFTFELILERQVDPKVALGLVVWSGVIFVVMSATPLRRLIAQAIPVHLREAIAGGIGMFLAFIGLRNSGLIVDNPATLVGMGELSLESILFLVGLIGAIVLQRKSKPYAFLVPILGVTLLAVAFGKTQLPEGGWYSMPDMSLLFSADMVGSFDVVLLPPLLTLIITDLFDSLSTFLGVAQSAGLLDEDGEPLRVEQALAVDAAATLASGLVGTSSATTYVESTAGIEAGGRTGLTAVVAGLAFLPFLFLGPLVAIVPGFATGPVLVILGALMMRSTSGMTARPLEDRIPAFMVIILIPLTFSITNGILCGLVLQPLLYLLVGRQDKVSPMLWVLFVIGVGMLTLDHSAALDGLFAGE
jgi:AGZA family xanthine/uracil permease-like MFS transporter